MSIILKALRKVQHQNSEQPSDPPAPARGKGGDALRDATTGSEPTSATSGSRTVASADIRARQARAGATSSETTGRHRFGGVPKLLLAVVVAVGMFATGWFLNRIYSNFASETEAREARSRIDVGEVQPPADAPAAVPSQAEQIVPAAPEPSVVHPAEPTSSNRSVVPPIVAPPPQVIRASAVEPPPRPPAETPAEESPASSTVAAERSEPRMAGRHEKEAGPTKAERPKFKINAIAWRLAEPKAVVNMRVVYVGDVIEGATVVAIHKTSVIFEFEGETFEVRFGSAGSD